MKKKIVIVSLAAAAMLAACSGGDGGNDPIAKAVMSNGQPATQAATPTPQPTAQPTTPATVQQAQQVITQWATVIVRETVVVQQPVDRVVIVTPTPDIQGFTAPASVGMDESTQPCPVKFWKRGRCTATQAQIEAAASEVTK